MIRHCILRSFLVSIVLASSAGCAAEQASEDGVESSADELKGPGRLASDARRPELGNDLRVLASSKVTMAEGIAEAEKSRPVIEAKYELDAAGKLSLSLYPIAQPLSVDAERQTFRELAGDPTKTPFRGSLETFGDQAHLTRSARDLTLIQLSKKSLSSAVSESSSDGFVFWAIPTMRAGRAGYGVYTTKNGVQKWRFVDGQGSREHDFWHPKDLGAGPGAGATDARVPELGETLAILRAAKVSMFDALLEAEREHGATIEAKYEIGDDGKLSLSVYSVGKGLGTDAERNTFFELAGDPTSRRTSRRRRSFKVPDAEHLTRSARDLTIVQAAAFDLPTAVLLAEIAMPDGFVYWAIPTTRDTRAGYGIYILGRDGKSHYFFLS
jgi:hypothetical protein